MTYREAYDKIIEAYFKDEIRPTNASFCFCGTLCDNDYRWCHDTLNRKHNDFGSYTGPQYVRMERALLDIIKDNDNYSYSPKEFGYEDRLFLGMSAALDVLKEIHRSRGENVDDTPAFTKRPCNIQIQ